MNPLKKLLHEIHGRSLWQVLGVYLAGSWGALQVVETVVESASLPEWLPAMALVLLVIGLPIVMATAVVQSAPAGPAPAAPESGANLARPPQSSGSVASLFTWNMR
jgi:fatty acid desaturase